MTPGHLLSVNVWTSKKHGENHLVKSFATYLNFSFVAYI